MNNTIQSPPRQQGGILQPLLLPPPKKLRIGAGWVPWKRPRCIIENIGRPEQGAYRLKISPAGILIEAGDPSGLFYGRQTLTQLRSQFKTSLPSLQILDWPDFAHRGFYLDITRGKVPTLKTLIALADKCAHYKLNQLQLYIEHTFAFKRHPEVWRGADPLSAEEILKLDAHCAKQHIDLVPSFSTFGHFYGWIHTKKFQHLNEFERDVSGEPFNTWDRQMHYTLDCQNPESIELVSEIISEVRPLFRSKYFNICADETFDLGKGKNRALAEKVGTGRLYVDFLNKIMAVVHANDAIPMFWGDIIEHHPELIRELPADAIFLDWNYSPKPDHNTRARLIAPTKRPFYVCSWCAGSRRWMNDFRGAHRNITRLAKIGLKMGALGFLNTEWGDRGHVNALGLAFPGLITGAAASWNAHSARLGECRIEKAISHYEFGDSSGRLLSLLREAASGAAAGDTAWPAVAFWKDARSADFPDDWFDADTGIPNLFFQRPAREHAATLARLRVLVPKIERCLQLATPRDRLVADEIRTGLLGLRVVAEMHLLLHARRRRVRLGSPKTRAVADRILLLEKRVGREWLRRNKPSEYAHLKKILMGAASGIREC